MSIIVLNPFTLDADKHSDKFGLACKDPSLTVQADAEAADINNIVRNFGIHGGLPYGDLRPVYDDFTHYPTDYHAALNFVRAADTSFMEFPAEFRSKFDNDPGAFLAALSDPDKRPIFEEAGLVPPIPVDAVPPIVGNPGSPPAEPTVD